MPRFWGTDGDDVIEGLYTDDTLVGGDGDDVLNGFGGDDELFGGDDDDVFIISGGNDEFHGGNGWDVVRFDQATFDDSDNSDTGYRNFGLGWDNGISVDLTTGRTAVISDGRLFVFGSIIYDGIEEFEGTSHHDEFVGSAGSDNISALGGDDWIQAGAGDDTLNGGRGADYLIGGAGADALIGGDLPANSYDLYVQLGIYTRAQADAMLAQANGGDTASYTGSLGVDVDLERATQIGSHAQGDVLTGIENLDGSQFGDVLRGNNGANLLFGDQGADTLEGRGGADVLNGGIGVDTATYESSASAVSVTLSDPNTGFSGSAAGGDAAGDTLISIENLTGSRFADTLIGSSVDNRLRGGDGADVLRGLGGDDVLEGGVGNDTMDGGDDDDTLDGGAGNDTLRGGAGIDTADYSSWDLPPPSTGLLFIAPRIEFRLGLNGGTGTATRSELQFPSFSYTVVETDTLNSIERLIGSNNADSFYGNELANQFQGADGADIFFADAGGDTYFGDGGVDTVDYSSSAAAIAIDLASSAAGSGGLAAGDRFYTIENIVGSTGNDTIRGNASANRLDGDVGADTLVGRSGNDTYVVDNVGDVVVEALNDGIDTVESALTFTLGANLENLTLTGSANLDGTGHELDNAITGNIGNNTLVGGLGADTLLGGRGDDTLRGGQGSDTLNGGIGDDILVSGTGNDVLIGGNGRDVLTGGADADTFVWQSMLDSAVGTANRDIVADFVRGEDRIDLSAIDANTNTAGNDAFGLVGAFTGIAGQLRVFTNGSANTIIEGDVDGNGVADFQIELTGSYTLTASDFLL